MRLALSLGVLIALGASAAFHVAHGALEVPLVSVRVTGEFRHLTREELSQAIAGEVRAGFYGVKVSAVRAAALALPWVRDVSVRRVWPDSLNVDVSEREASARWRGGGLLEADGTLFFPPEESYPGSLPVLGGPEGTHGEVMERFQVWRGMLAPLGRPVHGVSLTPRRTWRIELDQGTALVVGSDADFPALAKFTQVGRAVLGARMSDIQQIDLRYTNGFAVQWKGQAGVDGQNGDAGSDAGVRG